MQKRRERIEKWRAERKKKAIEEGNSTTPLIILPPTKKWNLEVTSPFSLKSRQKINRSLTQDDEDDELPGPTPNEEKTEKEPKPVEEAVKVEEKEMDTTTTIIATSTEVVKKEEPEAIIPLKREHDDVDPLDAFMQVTSY